MSRMTKFLKQTCRFQQAKRVTDTTIRHLDPYLLSDDAFKNKTLENLYHSSFGNLNEDN